MKRRAFVTGLGVVLVAPRAIEAQQARSMPRLCVLAYESLSPSSPWAQRYRAFVEGLRDLGYVDRRSIAIHFLSADGDYNRFPALAGECVRLEPDIIVAYTTPGSLAAKNATSTIPIITGPIGDPIGTGLVGSLARPGGNITGQTVMATGLGGKRLQLLKEAVPALSRLLILSQRPDPVSALQVQEIEKAAGPMGLRLMNRGVGTPDELSAAVAAAVNEGAQAVVTTVGTFFIVHRTRMAEVAASHRLPAMYPVRDFVDAGGLMSYGPNTLSLYRRTAVTVDKILKGAKPGDLPMEEPTTFELVINMKAAKALGLTIPPSLLLRADQVIE
jgi:putative tryptophan/tyrosine transport system substrate-binding protein